MNISRKSIFKSIPFLISCSILIISIVFKQYTISFLSIFFIIGIPLVLLVSYHITEKFHFIFKFALFSLIISSAIIFGFLARGTFNVNPKSQVWDMHEIDNPGLILPNGLDRADVNKDGFDDYVTNYEWDGEIRIAFHPGLEKVKDQWPTISIGFVENAESAAFGDFDGDGNQDVVVAHGKEFSKNSGVFIIFSPSDYHLAYVGNHWIRSEDILETIDGGHFHYVKSRDINQDGAIDIVVGGRGTNPKAALKWIENPNDTSSPREVKKWKVHNIDPDLESGHGFVFGDIDLDGDEDIALCNSDWDTDEIDEKVIYYENPGNTSTEQKNPWTKKIIYQGSEFYSKEQVVIFDLTNDSYPDIIMQTINDIYLFENPGISTENWNLIKISKIPEISWRARPIKIADINNDGKPDIVGMLIHKNGRLPKDKAAIFWMEYSGNDPQTATWKTHTVKWGDGFIGLGKYNGEKWDQFFLEDVDRDGDLDIIANCEEYNSLGFVYIAVVWFENPLI